MNINRALLIYTAIVASGILFTSVRASFAPDPTNKLEFDLAQVKETVQKMSAQEATKEGQLTQEVNNLRAQIAQNQTQEETGEKTDETPKTAVLGKSTSTLGQIKIAEGYEALDIYEDTSFSSPVAGKIEPEKTYPYLKKKDNWLLVKIDEGSEGWVNNKLVTITESQGSP